jgi:hypothetical protein
MVRYFYAWMPAVVVVATAVILICPYLAVIVLIVVLLAAIAALGALAWAIVAALYRLGRAALGRSVPHRSEQRSDTSQRIAPNPGGLSIGGTR